MPRFYLPVTASLLILIVFAFAPAQEQRKMVEWANHRNLNTGEITEPWSKQIDALELEEILIGTRVVTIGDPVLADTDWINELTFRVKNISAEYITFVQITVTLPEITRSPQIPFLAPCGNRENQTCLRPGEQVDLKIPKGKLYDWVKEQVAKEKAVSVINRAAIDMVFVTTRKGSQVMAGCLKTADSRNTCPHKYAAN